MSEAILDQPGPGNLLANHRHASKPNQDEKNHPASVQFGGVCYKAAANSYI